MTTAELLTLIPILTTATITIIAALKARKSRVQVEETHYQVFEMGKQLNGRLAELIEATRQSAYHAGLVEGQRLQRAAEHLSAFDATTAAMHHL